MATGKVKFFNEDKGFGFIAPDAGGDDVFVHHSGLVGVNTLLEGDVVSYDVIKSERDDKVKAVEVTPLS